MIKNFTVLMLIGIIYNFAKHLLFTYNPLLVNTFGIGISNIFFTFVSEVFIIVFFIFFANNFSKIENNQLMNASIGVAIASLGVLVIDFVNNLGVLLSAFWLQDGVLKYLSILIVWLSSIFLVYFFVILYSSQEVKGSKCFGKTVVWAFSGAIASLVMQSIKLLNYFYLLRLNKAFCDVTNSFATSIGLLLVLLSFITMVSFLLYLLREFSKTKAN